MTNQQESPEIIKARYKKANQDYKKVILRKYGISNIDRINEILSPKSKEVKMTQAELANVFLNSPVVKMTVCFNKQLKETDILEGLMFIYQKTAPVDVKDAFKTVIKNTINGVTTTRTGFHNNKKDAVGRFYFVDEGQILDKSKSDDNRMIMLSLNNWNWIEVNKVKYILK